MPRRFTDEDAREKLRMAGYVATEPYPGSDKRWKASCSSCGEDVELVYNQVIRDDRPACACRRAQKVAIARARGEAAVHANAEDAVSAMRSHAWEALESYPGAGSRWQCRCLRCGTTSTPVLATQKMARGCSTCSGRAKRVTHDIAERVMRGAGWIPIGSYPGPRVPWPSRCQSCGKISQPRYETTKSQKSGCRSCSAIDNGRKRREMFAPNAIARMKLAHLEPQLPFPGSNKPWLCKSRACGNLTSPTYGDVSQGSGGCGYCRRSRQGVSKRSRYAGDATQRIRDAGFEPLIDYPGAEHPWPMRCRCGRTTTVRIGNVDAGQRGCRFCADYGFSSSKPAVAYLLEHDALRALKVGITQKGSTRIEIFGKHGWGVVHIERFEVGIDAVRVEDAILRWWRQDLSLKIHLTSHQTPVGGWTETIDADEMSGHVAAARLQIEAAAVRQVRQRSMGDSSSVGERAPT